MRGSDFSFAGLCENVKCLSASNVPRRAPRLERAVKAVMLLSC